jgi:hypothetical protein
VECARCPCVWSFRSWVSGELGNGGEGAGVGAEGAESECETMSTSAGRRNIANGQSLDVRRQYA